MDEGTRDQQAFRKNICRDFRLHLHVMYNYCMCLPALHLLTLIILSDMIHSIFIRDFKPAFSFVYVGLQDVTAAYAAVIANVTQGRQL